MLTLFNLFLVPFFLKANLPEQSILARKFLMNPTRFLLILFCLFSSLHLSAQQRPRLILKTGMNMSWQSSSLDGYEVSPLISTHLTALTEVQLAKRLFIQPGMSLQGKGLSTMAGSSGETKGRVNMMYLEIPINLLYKFTLANLGRMNIGGGPYAALGLNGKERNGSPNVFRGIAGSDGYTNTDFGINLIAGKELSSRFTLSLQQSIGLDNVAPVGYMMPGPADQPYPADVKNRVSSVSVGYRF